MEVESAEPIARVVADIRAGRVRAVRGRELHQLGERLNAAFRQAATGPIVDATGIYRSLVAREDPVALYEDHPCIAPPWDRACVAYQNEHGNVIVMAIGVDDYSSRRGSAPSWWDTSQAEADWTRVRWVTNAFFFVGGRSADGSVFPTAGPVHMTEFATYDDGEPADIHWVHIVPEYPLERWDMASVTLLGALNFMNCRNVELVEPQRPRSEARRIARTGVTVQTINVFPVGNSTRSAKGEPVGGQPLTSVRGHFATYGPEHGRGLLFGKYSGRFWIPQHARGDRDAGERQPDYRLVADVG